MNQILRRVDAEQFPCPPPRFEGAAGSLADRSQSTADWWAIQVRPGREHSAAEHLQLRGYETLLPCYVDHRRWSDRVKKVERALFAGYLFCRLTMDVMSKAVSAPGVIRIVGNSRGPLPIPTAEIDAVRRVVETKLAVSPWPFVRIGQQVRVEAGPLRDLEGTVLATKSGRRLIISIPLLQQSVAVELDVDWISVQPTPLVDRPTRSNSQG
jgi:transcription antitermination factor NusG